MPSGTTPLLSIIIPAYNEEKYIGRLLDSLSTQVKAPPFDVIVVDGQSQDQTVTIAESYRARLGNLSILRSPKRGISTQRNLGTKRAKAETLLFLDADTCLPAYFIATLIRHTPKTALHEGTCLPLTADMNLETYLLWPFSYPLTLFFVWFHKFTMGYCLVSTKSLHDKIGGFREDLWYAEDTDYGKRARAAGAVHKFYRSPQVYFSVRRLVKTGIIPWLLMKLRESWSNSSVTRPAKGEYKYGIFTDTKKRDILDV